MSFRTTLLLALCAIPARPIGLQAEGRTLRLLTIGNSFSRNATNHLPLKLSRRGFGSGSGDVSVGGLGRFALTCRLPPKYTARS